MTPAIRSLFTAVSLMVYAAPALADDPYMAPLPPEEPLVEGLSTKVSVEMEGFFTPGKSTPYVELVHQQEAYSLTWGILQLMIKNNDYRTLNMAGQSVELPQEQILQACQMLRDANRDELRSYNIGKKTLPPLNHTCQ